MCIPILSTIAVCLCTTTTLAEHHHHQHGHHHHHLPTNTTGVVSLLDNLVALNHSLESFVTTLEIVKLVHSLGGQEEKAHGLLQHLIDEDGGLEGLESDLEDLRRQLDLLEQGESDSDAFLLTVAEQLMAAISERMKAVEADWNELLRNYGRHDHKHRDSTHAANFWSPWSAYSPCSVTCGLGSRTRTRTCSKPSLAEEGVHVCVGSSTETKACFLRTCLDNYPMQTDPRNKKEDRGQWSEWIYTTACSATCGAGVQTRVRTCSVASTCEGPDQEEVLCQGHMCPSECSCGEWPNHPNGITPQVLGAKPTNGPIPWQAALVSTVGLFEGKPFCGGVLVSPGFVLTAAHCLKEINGPGELQVLLGLYKVTELEAALRIDVSEIIKHPDAEIDLSKGLRYDLTLLRLAFTISFSERIMQVCMPSGHALSSIREAQLVHVSGWGLASETETPNELQETTLHLHKCAGILKALASTSICAGARHSRTCQGDSGSPLTLHSRRSGRYVLLGVVSAGPRDCSGGGQSAYANVTLVAGWISEYTATCASDGRLNQGPS